jgi:hypothetical protein
MTAARNLILPSSSRQYVINNNTTGGFALTVKGSATSGVTLVNGEKAHVFWNGSDYAKLSNAPGGAGTFSSITNTGLTSGRVVFSTTGGLETDSAGLTFDGTNFATTGTATAAKLIPTGSSATGNGMYLPATNALGFSTNGTNAVYIDASQNVGIGGTTPASNPKLSMYGGIRFMSTETAAATYTGIGSIVSDNVSISTVGTEKVRIDSSGNVGIGTSSPGYRLDVLSGDTTASVGYAMRLRSNATATAATIQFTNSSVSTQNGTITVTDAGLMSFSGAVYINSSSNVGIGNSSPTAKLDVTGAVKVSGQLTVGPSGSIYSPEIHAAYVSGTSQLFIRNLSGANRIDSYNDPITALYPLQLLGSVINLQTTDITRLSIDASGNVGIGTSSPTGISTYPTLDIRGSAGGGLRYGYSTVNGFLYANSAGGQIGLNTNDPLAFFTNALERMRIESSGNLLVATTNSTPGNGSGNNVSGFAVSTNGTTWASRDGFEALSVNRVDTTGGVLRAASAGTQVGGISVTSSATAFNTSSDYRLKQDIAPMTGALIKVAALKPVTYKWKRDGSDGEGFIAHELAEVCPQAVTGAKDAVDADGNPEHQGIDTSFLVATLTAAIQEQQALITSLTARITALEST